MSRPLLTLLAVAAGASVANVYYAQPLLDRLAQAFALDRAVAGAVLAATQAGSVLALLGLLPLADRGDRRRLLRLQLAALVAALLWLAAARTTGWLLSAMLLAGLLGTALTQGLIAYTAAMAPAAQRGRVVGVVQGGVFIGLLLARVLSGTVAAIAGWQAVYLLSAALMAALAVLLWRRLPAVPIPAVPPRWRDLIGSMLGMLRRDRTLRERGPLALLLFAGLNVFWAAAPLPLSAPPLHWSTAAIGALGLAGVVVALMAARVGHWMDRGFAHRVSLGALLLMLVAWWPLLGLPRSLSLLLLGVVVLDLGGRHSMSRTGHCCCVHRQNSMGAWWRYTCCSMQLAVGRCGCGALGAGPAWLASSVPVGRRHRAAGAAVVGSMAGGGVQRIGWRANR